jgi:CHASE2 domain-containing sensor protein
VIKSLKSGFWRADWFLGVIVVLAILFASGSDLLQSLERKAYDMGVLASSRAPSERIAVIAIDDASIANIGRWPWSREVHARMTDILAGAKAKVIGNTVFFSEPQLDPGYQYITKLLEQVQKSQPAPVEPPPAAVPGAAPAPAVPAAPSGPLAEFVATLEGATRCRCRRRR